ncbi:MAG TPA: AAA family ATPase [Solirubrobacteraceae bacterium]|jgi:DNA-binding NarL/FixJ family response regulator
MAIHGRDAELSAVSGAVEAALSGTSRPVVLVGEAGIGKSALVAAAAERARDAGLVLLRGRAVEPEEDVPFALAAAVLDDHADAARPETLSAHGPELAAILPSVPAPADGAAESLVAAERFRYHRALRALVDDIAADAPYALLLDDLHWADEASLEWVLHLLRRPPRAAGALVLAARPGQAALRLLDAAREEGVHLALAPLPDEAALELLTELTDRASAQRIVGEAGGNPLFLRELARVRGEPGEGLPTTIVATVHQEVARLDEPVRELLAGAAVAGEPFDGPLAAIAAGLQWDVAAEALDALVAADLIRLSPDGRTFRFRHPVVGRAVYDAIPPARRLAAHERVADKLARRNAAPALRAHHVERCAAAGDEAAAELLALAAEQSVATAPALAARWWATALDLMPHEPTPRRGELLVARARALAAAGEPEEALRAFDAARELPGTLVSAAMAASVERALGRHAAAHARLVAAAEHASGPDLAAIQLELSITSFILGDLKASIAHARRAVEAGPGSAAMQVILAGLETVADVWAGNADRDAIGAAEARALALPEREAFDPGDWLGTLAFTSDRFGPAARLLGRAVAAGRWRREDHRLPRIRSLCALALHFDLRPLEALEQAEAGEDGARLLRSAAEVGFALSGQAIALDDLGRTGEAEATAARAVETVRGLEQNLVTVNSHVLSAVIQHAHDPERMLDEVLAALGPDLASLERRTTLLRYVIAAALATGRRAEAEAWTARAEGFIEQSAMPGGRVRVACARAELLLADDEADRALATAADALALAEAESLRYDTTRARIVVGRAAAAAGDRDRAIAALERTVADTRRAGADGIAAEATRELRAIGARVSAGTLRAAGGADELSDRERSIAELVAPGRSNKEVAGALFLSTKTVENNLSRIYAKLGVRTRTELARVLPPSE